MSQQSDTAETVYSGLAESPVPLANLVREIRTRWGAEHGVGAVHGFVAEAAACLLRHEDVEIGDILDGRFVPWRLEPWDAHTKLDGELLSGQTFFEDETRAVFRITQKA